MEVIIGRSSFFAGIFSRSTGFGSSNLSTIRCLCLCDPRRWNVTLHERTLQDRLLPKNTFHPRWKISNVLERSNLTLMYDGESFRTFATQTTQNESDKKTLPDKSTKMNIFQKMRQLTRDYWHILIPVHLATSVVWVAIFYTAAKNGVDIVSILEFLHIPEIYIEKIQNSKAGDLAVTYALYKIFTPLRYTVTVGGTTMAIRHLDKKGYLKFGQPGAASARKSNDGIKEKAGEDRIKDWKDYSARKD